MINFKHGLVFITLFTHLYFAHAQNCSYLAYEPFNNIPNTALQGLQGGSGWDGAWLVQNQNTTVPGYQTESGNLSFSDLQLIGEHASGGHLYLTAGRTLDRSTGGSFDSYLTPNGHIGQDGTTLWFSALVRKNTADGSHIFVELNGDPVGWIIQPWEPHTGFGYYGTDSEVGGEQRWSLRIGETVYPSTSPVVTGETVLAVISIHFDASAGHAINLYINPPLGSTPPVAADVSQVFMGDLWLQGIAVFSELAGNGSFDEIRFAESFECVAPNNSVVVNVAPTSVITASSLDGNAPFSVTLDGAASFDPDGSIVSYEWDLGDGTPVFTQSVSTPFTHVFTSTGLLTISLKVTDDSGATHTFLETITVRDANGTFSCQIRASLLNPASCSQNNGSIQIDNFWNGLVQSYTMANSAGTMLPTPSNHIYENLAPDTYTLTVQGMSGCTDVLDLTVSVDSSTCAGWTPQECRMEFGMNLNYPSYYTAERPFKNLFRFNGGFYSTYADTPWISSNEYENMPKNAEGYPLEIPWTDNGGVSHIVKVVVSDNHYYPEDTLVVLYEGQGTLSPTVPMINVSAGRFEIVVNHPGQILFDMYASQLGDPIRNIRVLRKSDEFDDLIAEPFHQAFLDRLQPFQVARFMNWMRINHSTMTTWSERTLPNYYNQSDIGTNLGGVAYEYLVQLCNTLQIEPWICIPHQVDDNYIVELAQLFRDNLDPNLTVYIEYSNEVWNWGFQQAHWVTDNGPANLSPPRRYAERATRAMQLFRNEFVQPERVKRILGTQLTNNWVSDEILAHAQPSDYDYLSPSAYFGYPGGSCAGGLNGASTALDVIDCTRQTFYEQYDSWRQDYWNVKMYGKEMVNYEAGNHMTDFNNSVPYADAIREAQTHPAIYDLYQEVIDSLRVLDTRLCMYFVLAARLGNSVDVFGHLDDIDMPPPYHITAPKYQVLLDNIVPSCESGTPQRVMPMQVFLQGAYTGSGMMSSLLADENLTNLQQPYDQAPWNYSGAELLTSLFPELVDWVLVELRPENDINIVLNQKAALLLNNGHIVDLAWLTDATVDGVLMNADIVSGNYHVVVRHRNHLAVITNTPVALPNALPIDFADPLTVMGGGPQMVDMTDGYFALTAGDGNADGVLSVTDFNIYTSTAAMINQYLSADFNMDGNVTVADFNLYQPNSSKIGVSAVRY